ncbi:hypothetical protein [Streptomyces sp. enrichment culture]|uniref:hypothetical protein n=1 Tax=Streptomyces sp. enrichment culture TaxID=1795815 RepID=UPI003F546B01
MAPDRFAVSYETLYELKRQMHRLADDAESGGGGGVFEELGKQSSSDNKEVFGSQYVASKFGLFYRLSAKRVKDGADGLRRFGNTFEGFAHVAFEQDGVIASSATTSATSMQLNRWKSEKAAHDEWEQKNDAWNAYVEKIGAADYLREHPDTDIDTACQAEGPGRPAWCDTYRQDMSDDIYEVDGISDRVPPQPGKEPDEPADEPPHSATIKDGRGNVISTNVTYDDDYNVTTEESVVRLENGEEYTTRTEYHGEPTLVRPDSPEPKYDAENDRWTWDTNPAYSTQDYTSTSTSPDGSVTVEEVRIDDSGSETPGSGKRTVTTTTEEDGEETVTVTEYTRDGPYGEWVKVEDESDSEGESGGGDDETVTDVDSTGQNSIPGNSHYKV